MFLLLLLSLFTSTLAVFTEECPIPYSCNSTTDSVVEEFCNDNHAKMFERCCILGNTTIGLDLRNCAIKELNLTQTVFSSIECLDLRDNEYEKLTSQELIGLLKLNDLYLPQNIPCPGGKPAWNKTEDPGKNWTHCIDQRNMCESLNITCGDPENAHCKPTGPGSAKCVCNEGHFGYKCMNDAEFPVALFTSSVIIPTIVLSIVLWFLQGRDPKRLRKL